MAVIAIDGPSGAGKSSVSRAIAQKARWGYLETGALYRGVTWLALQEKWPTSQQLTFLVEQAKLTFNLDPTDPKLCVCYPIAGEEVVDLSAEIRQELITDSVSQISALPEIRSVLLELQRDLIKEAIFKLGGVVVEGRDIGSTVWPEAELKIFLTADLPARAARRQAQLSELAEVSENSVADSLTKRDQIDSSRSASPLRQSEDQIVIDATYLNLEETIAVLWKLIEERKLNG